MNVLVHLTYLGPLVAAILILFGFAPRRTAITGAVVALISSLILFLGYDHTAGGYQFASALPLVPAWDLKFYVGVDGLNATMLFLTSLVALAAAWMSPRTEENLHRYMACV
ncbi:MAG TPA: hypothetical protein VK673_09160, partial [Chthoniobacterales bacterium]|nr:hypothetical protein [Chthoniobacterales bacterium]